MSTPSFSRRAALASIALAPVVAAAARAADAPVTKPSTGGAISTGPTMSAIAMLMSQADQWSTGDLTGFCAHYDENAVFVSPSGLTRGRQAVFDRYAKKYAAGKAPPPGPNAEAAKTMGALSFEIIDARGDERFTSVVMTWALAFPDKPKATGYSGVALEKKDGKWLIIHDASM